MIEKDSFLEKYNIDKLEFENTKIVWDDLMLIFKDYLCFKKELEQAAIYLFNTLMLSEKVHSVRYRIKDEEHLIEKIIRKKITENHSIDLNNYKEEINDLIGLRALHLFKADWLKINGYIIEKFNLFRKPIANYRKGDSEDLIRYFSENGCEPKEHKYGYRSIHYILETQPYKLKLKAEIQVRTIYEEAWAEIDHTIRYPYDLGNILYSEFLLILNRLSGSADEMGSFIQSLKKELLLREIDYGNKIKEKDKIILDLEEKLSKLDIKDKDLNSIKEDLNKLKIRELNTFPDFDKFTKDSERIRDFTKSLTAIENFSKLNDLNEKLSPYNKISKIAEMLDRSHVRKMI